MRKQSLKSHVICLMLAITLLPVVFLSGCGPSSTSGSQSGQETVYDRVLKAGKIRAAYITYPPA
jgi:hypothetical protein